MMLLAATAAAFGVAAALVFRLLTNLAKVRATANQIAARMMELALFVDEPRTVFRAQVALVRENLRLLAQIAIPSLIMGAAFALAYPKLQARYNNPNPDILTLPLGSELPANVTAEAPPVRVPRMREVSWRVHPRPTNPHWLLWFATVSTASAVMSAVLLSSRRYRRIATINRRGNRSSTLPSL